MPADLLQPLLVANATARRRQLVWLQGEAGWAREQAAALLASTGWRRVLWVGDEAPAGMSALSPQAVQRQLGAESDAVVFDAFAGFNPNAFGQCVGTIRGGGLLLLLSPPADAWRDFADPEHRSIAVLPYGAGDVGHRFLRRLVAELEADDRVIPVRQHRPWPGIRPLSGAGVAELAPAPFRTLDQQRAVAQIGDALEAGDALVLTADRGRGKSAALGLAAADWLARRGGEVLVTAPGLDAVSALFERLRARWPEGDASNGTFHCAAGLVRFLAPDRLAHGDGQGEVLLVDEAAAIPAPVLARLLGRFRRIVFASTIHGYEGTGRGFAVRFRRELQRRRPGWRSLTLKTPVRFCSGDPLEELSFRILMLDAEPAPADAVAGLVRDGVRCERMDRERLLAEPRLLGELFGLLVLAHYRTTPGDLRILLDSPNLSVWVALWRGEVAGAMLVVEEGGLPEDLAQAIREGRRRPRGHLIPQALIGQDGLMAAASLRCWRVMRIATHPAVERRGVASALLDSLAATAHTEGCDYLATCFGATTDLMAFWQRNGYRAIRIGSGQDPVGGTFACMLAAPLSDAGAVLVRNASSRLRRRLLHQLPAQFAGLDPALVLHLLPSAPLPAPTPDERRELEAFARHNLAFESCEPVLWTFCNAGPETWRAAGLSDDHCRLLVWLLLQRRDWPRVAALTGDGRKALVRRLRGIVGRLLDALPAAVGEH